MSVRPQPRNLILAAAAVALFVPALAACGPASQSQPGTGGTPQAAQGLPVSTAKVTRDTIASQANYGGSIQPKSQVAILPRAAGRVVKLPVDTGATVKAGDLLAELDHTTNDAQVAQARANVASAQANLAAAQARLSTVLAGAKPEDVAVAEAQVETARIRVAQVQAGGRPEDVRSAEASVVSAQARLDAAQAGGRIEDVLSAQASVESARNRLAQVLAAGRPEDVRAAEANLESARARLFQLQNPRPEDVGAALSAWDQAKTRLAQAQDAGSGSGVTARTRPEDMSTLELRVQRAQAVLDKAITDQAKVPTSGAGASTAQALQLAVTQAQIDLQIARNDLQRAQNTGPTEWDMRLLQEAAESARVSYERLVRPSQADVAAAQATLEQAQANLDKLRNVTPFDVETAQQALNQAEANLQKVRNPDPTTVLTAQAALDQAVAALEKVKSPTQFEIDTAMAALAQAEASLASRKNQYSTQDRQAAEAAVAQAQAAVDQQQAALAIQEANLFEAFVRAPFDGIVSDRTVSEGAVVSTNTTLMTLISREVDIALNVEELNIARFQEGAAATFSVTTFPNEQFRGIVTSVFPTGDARSRTFTVKVQPDDASGRLRPGMFAQMSVTLERRENVNSIPREAIVLRNDRPFAFAIVDSTASMRQLDLGLGDDRRVEVRSGLQTGEDIVISGQATLRDKDQVRLVPVGGGQRPAGTGAQGGQQGSQGQQGQQGQGQQGGQAGQRPPGAAGTPGAGQATPRPAG